MALIHHKRLDPECWFAESVSYQMANVGSEISRTLIWRNKKNDEYADLAFERALELIDLTASDPKNRRRLREILRVRELLVGWKLNNKENASEDAVWQKYFNDFAYAARNGRPAAGPG